MKHAHLSSLLPRTPVDYLWLALDCAYLAGYLLLAFTDLASYLLLAGLAVFAMAALGVYRLPARVAGGGEWLLLLAPLLPCSVLSRQGQLLALAREAQTEATRPGVGEAAATLAPEQQAAVTPSAGAHASLKQPDAASSPALISADHGGRPPWSHRLASAAMLLLLFWVCASGQFANRIIDPALAPLQQRAETTLQRSLTMAAASYASARLIDRGIAFISETEVGIGVLYVKPGQIFKPLQDMAVRYSDIMVLAMVSVGMQLLLLELGQALAISVLASAAFATLLFWQFAPRAWLSLLGLLARTLLVATLLIKLAIPLAAVAIGSVAEQVLDARRAQAQAQIDLTTEQLNEVQQVEQESGLMDWLKSVAGQASDLWAGVRNLSDNLIERLVTLLVIYLLETVLLPLLMLLLMWRLAARYLV